MSWNIRGLNSPLKQSEVKILIARYNIVLIGVLETRVRVEIMDWNLKHNYLLCNQGRIWVLYDTRKISLMVIVTGSQFIHFKLTRGNTVFFWTCVYGSYNAEVRRELLRDLARLGSGLNAPWLIQGDFNAICSNEDRVGGAPVNVGAANEFQSWILGLDLVEVQYSGPKFTWKFYFDMYPLKKMKKRIPYY
ncbi:DNase I-like protein [Dioscorea alata]|uniref:DNase I-like protein n=1 Tax=Dioscorea alata TaxID=55571 RepID=A0ACB7WPM9_DIOAL|nr:DNase I-like protein [Dioscorea alata]